MEKNFEKNSFEKRLSSMIKVDFRRMFTMPLVYILLGICLVMPIVILVMTSMMDGTVSTNPQTGAETVIEGFDNVWQILGATAAKDSSAAMDMSLTSMVNINMLYFGVALLVCVFVSDDFRSGYAKNLFTVRSKKSDYVISKTLVCSLGAALMIFAFFIGSMLGGAIAGVPFTMDGFTAGNVCACVLSKMIIVTVFVPIYLIMSVVAKQRLWLSILLSLATGMFLYTMVPMITPINSTLINVLLSFVGGAGISIALGALSKLVLEKTSLV